MHGCCVCRHAFSWLATLEMRATGRRLKPFHLWFFPTVEFSLTPLWKDAALVSSRFRATGRSATTLQVPPRKEITDALLVYLWVPNGAPAWLGFRGNPQQGKPQASAELSSAARWSSASPRRLLPSGEAAGWSKEPWPARNRGTPQRKSLLF